MWYSLSANLEVINKYSFDDNDISNDDETGRTTVQTPDMLTRQHGCDWSVDLSSSFNHPHGYMLLKTNEEMGEAGLAARQASQIEPSSLTRASSVGAMIE